MGRSIPAAITDRHPLQTGVALWTHRGQRAILVDPLTGTVTGRLDPAYGSDLVGHGYAIEGTPASYPTSLSLVNLATGSRHHLGWPSILHFGYRVLPEPQGPFVAVAFGSPAYTPDPGHASIDASDIWLPIPAPPPSGKFRGSRFWCCSPSGYRDRSSTSSS